MSSATEIEAREAAERDRVATLVALGLPMPQPEEPKPDLIKQAARLRGMDRAMFVSWNSGRRASIEEYAREVIDKARKPPPPVIDRRYIERARRGYRVRR